MKMSDLAREMAGHLAVTLMGLVDLQGTLGGGPAEIIDVDYEEGDRSFGILLADGRTLEVEVHETAPHPGSAR